VTGGLGGRLGARTPWTLVGGKGGVGKSTVAAMLALESAAAGEAVLLLSTDPAHSLGDVLDVPVGANAVAIPAAPGLRAEEMDASAVHRAFLDEYRAPLLAWLDAATYLEREEIAAFLDLSLPGADEVAAAIRLAGLKERPPCSRVIVDLAPTGHALRMVAAPGLLAEWLAGLLALGQRDDAVARAFGAGRSRPDHGAPLRALFRRLHATHAALRDPEWTRFVVVTTTEPSVLAESGRLVEALDREGVARAGAVINRALAGPTGAEAATRLGGAHGEPVVLPTLATPPGGVARLRELLERARPAAYGPEIPVPPPARPDAGPTTRTARRRSERVEVPLDRRLYLVVGKGGVGKSTVAAALALDLVEVGRGRVTVLGADPAGSLGEVWGCDAGRVSRPAPGVDGLLLRQVEASAERSGVGHVAGDATRVALERLVGSGGDRLLGLQLPGADEVFALVELLDLLDDGREEAVVLDAAPTGHLLRLLRTPAISEAWVHAAMRLLLRYREVVEFADPAEHLLRLGRQLRGLRERLADPVHTWTAVVTLPEPGPLAETARLIPGLRGVCAGPDLLLVNRVPLAAPDAALSSAMLDAARALARRCGVALATTPALEPGPSGADGLRRFRAAWIACNR
jgi:arsenite/tail-anchored protein-transporting ATPase